MSSDKRFDTKRGVAQSILPATFHPSHPAVVLNCAPIESALANFPISMFWTFSKGTTTTPDLLRSLASTLDVFPTLCATIHIDSVRSSVSLHLDNGNPVTFLEATSPLRLDQCMPTVAQRYDSNMAERQEIDCMLLPKDIIPPVVDKCKGSQVNLQWTRMPCGGAILGLSGYHFLDAASVGIFVSEWGRQCRSLPSQSANASSTSSEKSAAAPSFDRAFMMKGMEEAARFHPIKDCVFVSTEELAKRRASSAPATSESSSSSTAIDSQQTPPAIICRIYHFPREELELIRQAASSTPTSATASSAATPSSPSENSSSNISTHDALSAHLMQTICHASNTLSKDPVTISQVYNARRALATPTFFGSAAFVLTDSTSSTFASVAASLQQTAQVIHDLHASQNREKLLAYNGYLDSFASFADLNFTARIMTHDLHVVSWRHSGMYGVDFGSGACTYAGPGYFEGTRYLMFMDTAASSDNAGHGGVDVQLALEEPQWKKMMQDGMLHRFAPKSVNQ